MMNGFLRWIVIFALGMMLTAPSAVASREVTDLLGRRVVIPDSPQRVVALAPSVTEIVFALGREDRLAAVTRFSDYPPEARQLPKVGSYIHLDIERIVALQPDLCIAIKDGNPKMVVERLDSLNIPVFAVDPRGLDAVGHTLLQIGRLLNAEDRAKVIALDMKNRIRQVRKRIENAETKPRVFFQIGISPIVSAGNHTFINELIEMAGGFNLARGATPYPRFSREQVLALAPDIIIITSMARMEVFEQVKAQWQQWPDLPASRDNRIHILDSNMFDRPTPRLVKGLEVLARLIHPELFDTEKR